MPVQAHVLKNAIDVKRFSRSVSEEQKRSIRKKLGLSEKDFVVLYVGIILEVKGVLELMQAVTSLEDEHIKLLILGSANSGKWSFSSYERKVKKLSEQNKDRIIFTGYVDNTEVYKYASVANVQCVPSLWEEAAGLVVLEAMAAELPMIVSDSGGMIEYVNRDAALVIERESIIENLKKTIYYMKENPEIRKQMAENAKRQSIKYDEAIYYKNFLGVITEIIGE